MMHKLPRVALSHFMAFVTATALCLGIARFFGLVLGTFFVTLVICYFLASFLTLRKRAICFACSAFFALLPWLGLGHGSFYVPGASDSLPTVSLPSVVSAPLSAFYFAAETPLYCVAADGGKFSQAIFFAGEGLATVRPYAVFGFWLGLALVFGLSVATPLATKWRPGAVRRLRGST